MDVPETLDLEYLRAPGPQPGEVLQPEKAAGEPSPMDASTADDSISATIVSELMAMGFSENGSRRAVAATKVEPQALSVDLQRIWLVMHGSKFQIVPCNVLGLFMYRVNASVVASKVLSPCVMETAVGMYVVFARSSHSCGQQLQINHN